MGRPLRHKQDSTGRNASFSLLCAALAVSAGCSADDDRRTIDVFAASSLADIMELVEEGYEANHPEVDLRMNLAGTNALVRQINSGADAAILVAADASFVGDLVGEPAAPPVPLASNELTLVVPSDNPAGIDHSKDLEADGVLTARCATGVPCGDATDEYLRANDITIARSTEEANVRSVLGKVSSGEVDAGFVYRTDAVATTSVAEIPIQNAPQVTVTMARLDEGDMAADLADHLRSNEVAALFEGLGFGPATGTGDG